eukprot:gene11489-biopygen10913
MWRRGYPCQAEDVFQKASCITTVRLRQLHAAANAPQAPGNAKQRAAGTECDFGMLYLGEPQPRRRRRQKKCVFMVPQAPGDVVFLCCILCLASHGYAPTAHPSRRCGGHPGADGREPSHVLECVQDAFVASESVVRDAPGTRPLSFLPGLQGELRLAGVWWGGDAGRLSHSPLPQP